MKDSRGINKGEKLHLGKELKELNWKKSIVKSTILINQYDPATDIFDVVSPVCMEGSLMFLFSEKK